MLDNNPVKKWMIRRVTLPIWVLALILLFIPVVYYSLYQLKLESKRIENFCKQTQEEIETECKEARRLCEVTTDACNRKADICTEAACG